jgi:hypothetical protein
MHPRKPNFPNKQGRQKPKILKPTFRKSGLFTQFTIRKVSIGFLETSIKLAGVILLSTGRAFPLRVHEL